MRSQVPTNLLQVLPPVGNLDEPIQVVQRVGRKAPVAVVAAGLLALNAGTSLDEPLGRRLVGLHLGSGLHEHHLHRALHKPSRL